MLSIVIMDLTYNLQCNISKFQQYTGALDYRWTHEKPKLTEINISDWSWDAKQIFGRRKERAKQG